MAKNLLTNSEEYTNLIASANKSIETFIKRHPTNVKYETSEDGFTYIILEYGSVRDLELKKIAKACNETLNDDHYKIGNIRCTIVYASDLIIKFKGKTEEVATDLQHDELPTSLKNLVARSKVDVTISNSLVSDIVSFIRKYVKNKSNHTELFLNNSGLSYYRYGTRGRISINVDEVRKNSEMNDVLVKIVQPILSIYNRHPELITNNLSKQLDEKDIALERVNESSIMFSYGNVEFPEIINEIHLYIGRYITLNESPFGPPITDGNKNYFVDKDGVKRYTNLSPSFFKTQDIIRKIVIPTNITKDTYLYEIYNTILNNEEFISEMTSGNYSYYNRRNPSDYESPLTNISNIKNSMYITDDSLITISNISNLQSSECLYTSCLSMCSSTDDITSVHPNYGPIRRMEELHNIEHGYRWTLINIVANCIENNKPLNVVLSVEPNKGATFNYTDIFSKK